MKTFYSLFLVFFLNITFITAQIVNGTDTLYANEWINYNQVYFKIKIANDGMYRVDYQTLINAGLPVSAINSEQYQLFHLGQEVPLYLSATISSPLSTNDYIEFFGQQNKSELDRYLFKNPETEMMNPDYSLFNDTTAYFLTWSNTSNGLRYNNIINNINNPPNPEPYYWETSTINLHSYNDKYHSLAGDAVSQFDVAEGWGGGYPNDSIGQNITLPINNLYNNTSINAQLYFRFACRNGSHHQNVLFNNNLLLDTSFQNYQLIAYSTSIPLSQLTTNNKVRFEGLNSIDDYFDHQNVSIVSLRYPRLFDFENNSSKIFNIPNSNNVKYLEIQNFNAGTNPILYDINNLTRQTATVENNQLKIALPASSLPSNTERKLVLVNSVEGVSTINTLEKVNFIDYKIIDPNYIIITHSSFLGNANPVKQYATYRKSLKGGSFDTLVIDVQQIYDQFAYGVDRHLLGFRNMAHFFKKNWSDLQYIFIIGKGRTYDQIRTPESLSAAAGTFFIPTFGTPPSDNMLFGTNGSNFSLFPVGRISAVEPAEISNYLNKVKVYEDESQLQQTIADRAWQKEVIHLSGGGTNGLTEQLTIQSYLKTLGEYLEKNKFGGHITTFSKTSTDPIQNSLNDQIFERINNGVRMLTFFGHSAPNAFDFNIDKPDAYQNQGKYFNMLSLGCYSGNMHTLSKSIGEKFVFEPDKAAITFLASSGYSALNALRDIATKYYLRVGGENYGDGIGKIIRASIIDIAESPSYGINELLQQFTLLGDPAIKLNTQPTQDYIPDATSVRFNPNPISIEKDSFDINFDLVNLGRNDADSVLVDITQQYPNGFLNTVVSQKVLMNGFKKSLQFKLPISKDATGLNYFNIKADADEAFAEAPAPEAETNNVLNNISTYFVSNDLVPIYPPDFSIVGNQNINLTASTANIFAPEQKYLLQIDTSEKFTNPLALTAISQKGGIISWKPNITYKDSVVYYWRVSPDSTEATSYIWRTNSFLYLNGSNNGWNQSHFYQWQKDQFTDMEIGNDWKFKFLDDVKDLKIIAGIFAPNQPFFVLNNSGTQPVAGQIASGAFVMVLDSLTVTPWENPPGGAFGSVNNNPDLPIKAFPFRTNTLADRAKLINFLRDSIPSGYYVAILTLQKTTGNAATYKPELWAADSTSATTGFANLFQILENQGATKVRNLATIGSHPYGIIYRKDRQNVFATDEILMDTLDVNQIEELRKDIPGFWQSGNVRSTLVGPAKQWESFHWKTTNLDNSADIVSVNIYGIKNDGSSELLHNQLTLQDTTLAYISAEQYPYLQLQFNSQDTFLHTSPNLEYWRVIYQGLPEAALNPAATFTLQKDTLQQGEKLKLDMAIANISNYDMDSLLIKYTVVNLNNEDTTFYQRIKPLLKNDTLSTHFETDTRIFANKNRLIMEINPDKDQIELYHPNNVALMEFFVTQDKRNPLLDVTFDGEHIMNNDLVSSKPHIVINLKDENPYLPLSDTSLFKIFLQYPNEEIVPIYFNNDILKYYPAEQNASSKNNKATVEIDPVLLENGTYRLIVQANDVTGNESGSFDYKIAFQVIREQKITHVLNYPNPFSTSTRFVYTLTGDEPPAFFKIQIMTINGQIVRELTQSELGSLKVGKHMTEFAWDGTDQYGDRLANGIYFYKIYATKANGESYETMSNDNIDQYFKKEIGKMVIMR